jgi:hypothetical protein
MKARTGLWWRISVDISGAKPKDHPLYAPGFKWRERVGKQVPVWVPPAKDIKAGYLPKTLMLDREASPADLAQRCRKQWQDLLDWRSGKKKATRFDISWLVGRYLHDDQSPFHSLKPDTRQSYRWECKRIAETVGERLLTPKREGGMLIQRILGEDIRRWHHEWGHPGPRDIIDPDGTITRAVPKPTPSRARHCIEMLRTLFSYNVEIGTPGAADLREMMKAMRFKGANRRTEAPTFEQVQGLVRTALEKGYRSIAVTTLAQFELIERRTHIIGQWDGQAWGFGWVWDGEVDINGTTKRVGITPDWWIKYYQTKKGPRLREFDLKAVQPLLSMLQETPKEQRHGPIIVCEDTGQPWIKRRYQEKFREIARAAGVPDGIYSMDMRSGGATEVDSLPEVTDRMFDDAGGWSDPTMKNTYRREPQRNARKVVELRQAARGKS